jgi:AcrR family transcriptional regulator|tara:strand:- start:2885 stop:3643 length:759 start_codon:yes stop_codon:yes gene_type:complete
MPNPRTRSDSRKEEFLDLAEELFADLGYENTSVDRLISGLGVSKGAFYHHFKSKSDLLDAALERLMLRAEAQLEEVLAAKAPALEKLQKFIVTLDSATKQNRMSSLQIGEFLLQDGNAVLLARHRRAARDRFVPVLTTIIEQGVCEGDFHLDNPQLVARVVWEIGEAMEEALARPLILATENPIEPNEFLSIYNTYVRAIERVIGAPEGSLSLVDEIMLQSWIESVSNNIARIDPIDSRTTVLPLFPDREKS